MAQFVARIDDAVAGQVDDLVAAGAFASRSDAVRRGLTALIDVHRRRRIGLCDALAALADC